MGSEGAEPTAPRKTENPNRLVHRRQSAATFTASTDLPSTYLVSVPDHPGPLRPTFPEGTPEPTGAIRRISLQELALEEGTHAPLEGMKQSLSVPRWG